MKKAVIAWGRMNPVTSGHEKLVNKVVSVAKRERAEPRIYLSNTQNAKKDPLQYKDKIAMAKKAFGAMMKQSASRTLIQLMQELQKAGFTEITMVAGSDRVREYDTLLNKYNGKDYSFDKIKVVSAGERDPDAEGAAGMSATKLRKAAADGDEKTFMTGIPSKMSNADAKKLYRLVRKGLLVEEINRIDEEELELFTDEELEEFISEVDDWESLDEEILQERAPLTLQQRIKKARVMKRLAPKLKRQREIKKFRMAPTERLVQRARKLARNLLRKKMAGKRGEKYQSLTPSAKIQVDQLIAKKASSVERIAKRMLPMVRKKEIERIRSARSSKKESLERLETQFEVLSEKVKTPQDPEIADRKGTQPKRYHSGLSKSTKAARDAHFKKGAKMDDDNPAAYKPAPGDATAKTKPSKYTKKYKELFGEQDALDRAQERIKREKEANKRRHDRQLDRARTQDARTGVRKASQDNRGVSSSVSEAYELTEKSMDALKKKASKSGVSYGTLKKVYDRGVAAWRTGHRPGTTPQPWGYARVNAFITKKKAGNLNHDKDLANEYVPEERQGKQLVHHGETTKNFEICPSALKAFDDNQKAGMGDKEGFHDAVVAVDKYLGFEKELTKKGSASAADMARMKAMVNIAKQKISDARLPGHDYHQTHIDAVKDLMKEMNEGDGLWHNIHKKRREGKAPRKPYSKGAPTKQDFKNASEGAFSRMAAAQSSKADRTASNDKLRPGLDTYKKKPAEENFQDGKNPQDKGDAARHGLKGKTKAQLKKIRSSKTASKRKKQLAHWMINMHHNEETNLDESLQIEKGAGVGTFLTAADLGMKIKAGYADHPSVEEAAGEEGTDKLAKKYKKDTPGQ